MCTFCAIKMIELLAFACVLQRGFYCQCKYFKFEQLNIHWRLPTFAVDCVCLLDKLGVDRAINSLDYMSVLMSGQTQKAAGPSLLQIYRAVRIIDYPTSYKRLDHHLSYFAAR